MIESSSTFQGHLDRADATLSDFTIKMHQYYPASRKNLGAYILMRLGKEKIGTKKYQKWDCIWTEYCMYLNQKSLASTALANFHHRASSTIN
ncbi:hypothetical protein K2X92_06300 [Candidatus Gracilibacteria bacterium]|nr:hypothetical protein [Candidatus Gracilibacteria bacterium]